MSRQKISYTQRSTLPEIDKSARAKLGVDVVLIATGYFMTAVDESATHLGRIFGYEVRERDDGSWATGIPVNGLPSRLDILEDAGLRCAVVSGRQNSGQIRQLLYVTGDHREAPPPRSVAEILGVNNATLAEAVFRDEQPSANHSARRDANGGTDTTPWADRLLDIRVELLAEVWDSFLDGGDPSILNGLRAADLLERHAHRLASRPVRRRREGDDNWTPELDNEIVARYTSGRLIAEVARSVNRPTTGTAERLEELGYPGGMWPAWDAEAQSALQVMVDGCIRLPKIARSLRRSPWDITKFLTPKSPR